VTDTLAEIARYDWVEVYDGRRLHAPVAAEYDDDEWLLRDVTTACGLHFGVMGIPGLGARMGTKRCAHCCAALALPRGIGSPKNDDECRRLLGLGVERP
jgi:hypothetical protein